MSDGSMSGRVSRSYTVGGVTYIRWTPNSAIHDATPTASIRSIGTSVPPLKSDCVVDNTCMLRIVSGRMVPWTSANGSMRVSDAGDSRMLCWRHDALRPAGGAAGVGDRGRPVRVDMVDRTAIGPPPTHHAPGDSISTQVVARSGSSDEIEPAMSEVVTRSDAPLSSRRNRFSGGARWVLTPTQIAPRRIAARKPMTTSTVLGRLIATRSNGRTPARSNTSAARLIASRNSTNVNWARRSASARPTPQRSAADRRALRRTEGCLGSAAGRHGPAHASRGTRPAASPSWQSRPRNVDVIHVDPPPATRRHTGVQDTVLSESPPRNRSAPRGDSP